MQFKINIRHLLIIILCFFLAGVFCNCSSGPNPAPSTGTITGSVTDVDTNALLSGVAVSSGSVSDTTGSDGIYTLSSVAVGNQSITATLTGYQTYAGNVTVTQEVTSTENIPLIPSVTGGTTAQLMEGTWWVTEHDDGQRQDGTYDFYDDEIDGLFTITIGVDGSWTFNFLEETGLVPSSLITIDEVSNTVTLLDEDGLGRTILAYDATSNSINGQWQKLADDGVTWWENYETWLMTVPTGNEGTNNLDGIWKYNSFTDCQGNISYAADENFEFYWKTNNSLAYGYVCSDNVCYYCTSETEGWGENVTNNDINVNGDTMTNSFVEDDDDNIETPDCLVIDSFERTNESHIDGAVEDCIIYDQLD